ncbi:hypothetical protein [Mesorhizobium xinjiangense]|uniref:hypothetical protein n=1 Tax=Mesorhizobium xinjiangense TaxID=2678685 RepID=UPI0012EDF2D1|nr:hypothetical protein [Mesorhizobium xinjiangense]
MTIRHIAVILTLTAAIQPAFAGSSFVSPEPPEPAASASVVARGDNAPSAVVVSRSVIAMGVPAAPDETITAAVSKIDPADMDMQIRGGLDTGSKPR